MRYKKFTKLDFKKFHPSGSLGKQLKTVEDLMLTGKKIPFVNQNILMKKALKIIVKKKLGTLIVKNKKGFTCGILVDGDIKRASEKGVNIREIKLGKIMKKNPISVEKNTLAAHALEIMNSKKITSLCVHSGKKKSKTVGFVHLHNILRANIS